MTVNKKSIIIVIYIIFGEFVKSILTINALNSDNELFFSSPFFV
jgi:hypothetical protein